MPDDVAPVAPGAPQLKGAALIKDEVKRLPDRPGVYRMIGDEGEVLYVGKARSLKKRVLQYAQGRFHTQRIAHMVDLTRSMEFVTTRTETDALLLEINLIKQLKPRFNVLLRDDKSFPEIVIRREHAAAQLRKHRGAHTIKGDYFGPFASAWAVNRTLNTLQKAFLLRSCSDSVYESRTRPCMLHQIRRCSAPCTGLIGLEDYNALVEEAGAFLRGESRAVITKMSEEMQALSDDMEFERAARLRDRIRALASIAQEQQINPETVDEADVFALHAEGGQACVQVFFFRAGQNWGNRAYFPKADRSLEAGEVLGAFLAQFYDDKPPPRCIFVSHEIPDRALLAEALTIKSGRKVEVSVPQRGEKKDLVDHALTNAREALGRKLAETQSQQNLLTGLAETFGLAKPPRRVEVYDNSHIQGSNAVGAMIVAGPEGFRKNQYRKFNIKSENLAPGDDFGMMREVLTRRFKRLMADAPRAAVAAEAGPQAPLPSPQSTGFAERVLEFAVPPQNHDSGDGADHAENEDITDSPWPDLVFIDGGLGQLSAARETLKELGVTDVPLIGIAKGPERDAGRETFFIPGREPIKLKPRDPVLYFVQRLRDEAHRFAIGSHRQKRKKDIREAGLQEIPGIGPSRKRALLMHFGTLKEIERASITDLGKVPGVSAESARKIFEFFHAQAN